MKPENEAALAEMIRSANGPLTITGGGTRGMTGDGETLETGALSGISLYEPGALTIVAGAGTPLAEVHDALAAENQRLAFEPMDHRPLLGTTGAPTLGGVIAANVSGPRRIQGGAARDYALGVRFVDGAGNIVKNGGRVMKNVTGYDLVKLMCGACGTLGVLSEVALKVLPVPETSGTLVLQGLSDADAVDVMSLAMGSPYEITGAVHGAKVHGDETVTALRIEGFEQSVAYRMGRLKELFADRGAEIALLPAETSDALWERARDAGPLSNVAGDVWRVSCKPSDAPGLVARAGAQSHYFDWAGGLIWMRMAAGTDLRENLGRFDGHATLVRAGAGTRAALGAFHPEAAGVARLSAGLRARFDPRGILNPGLMGPVTAREVV
ncbi:FAD-binding protein [Roseobacter ponti]|uniref:FAD-binding protein n=1 Tax=Roseobacter ponti TaxID=1891787 RepID=A0A858SVW0_9RHOB|nr:FAD-binding protein [Roseobacter ponti]QJF52835.1 FAD-binding protein [Roseobacter ponti]